MPKIAALTRIKKRYQEVIRKIDVLENEKDSLKRLIQDKNRAFIENYKIVKENQKELI